MADFSALKTAIQTYIKQNGNEEITGEVLQTILLSVVTTLGDSAINDLITALNNEVAARQNADGSLEGAINQEGTLRSNADSTLQGNIDAEATARENADTALSNRLGSTITAENTAAEQIGAEAEAREAADTALQGLIDGITDNIENGYVYAGIATPSSTPVTGKVFYLALTAGTYTHFGNTVVTQGINILKYNGSAWSLDAFIGIDDELISGSNNLPKSGNVLENIIKNGSAFDLSAYNAVDGVLATYADLDAALTSLNALPAVYKQGGMSFKFVQSSDNKYVQARYMGTEVTGNPNPFLDANNWQVIDNIPTINAVRNSLIPIRGKVSIIGDSISTFAGTMPSGYSPYYPKAGRGVTNKNEMWWDLIFSLTGSQLDVNASWQGSTVVKNGSIPDFYERTSILGTPDYVFVELGTNDSAVLGDYDYESSITDLSETEFIPAYIKGVKALQLNYPSAKIVLLTFKMSEWYVTAIRNIGKHFNIPVIDVRTYYTNNVHPDKIGMTLVAQDIVSYFVKGKSDDKPTAGSERFVKSGGLYNDIIPLYKSLGIDFSGYIFEKRITSGGNMVDDTTAVISELVPIAVGDNLVIICPTVSDFGMGIYNSSKELINFYGMEPNRAITISNSNFAYAAISMKIDNMSAFNLVVNGKKMLPDYSIGSLKATQDDIAKFSEVYSQNNAYIRTGTPATIKFSNNWFISRLIKLPEGTIKLKMKCPSDITSESSVYAVGIYNSSRELINYYKIYDGREATFNNEDYVYISMSIRKADYKEFGLTINGIDVNLFDFGAGIDAINSYVKPEINYLNKITEDSSLFFPILNQGRIRGGVAYTANNLIVESDTGIHTQLMLYKQVSKIGFNYSNYNITAYYYMSDYSAISYAELASDGIIPPVNDCEYVLFMITKRGANITPSDVNVYTDFIIYRKDLEKEIDYNAGVTSLYSKNNYFILNGHLRYDYSKDWFISRFIELPENGTCNVVLQCPSDITQESTTYAIGVYNASMEFVDYFKMYDGRTIAIDTSRFRYIVIPIRKVDYKSFSVTINGQKLALFDFGKEIDKANKLITQIEARIDNTDNIYGEKTWRQTYSGDRITLFDDNSQHYTRKQFALIPFESVKCQSFAINGQYAVFLFHNTMVGVIYRLSDNKKICDITFPLDTTYGDSHNNACGFGAVKYDADDDFPVFCISQFNGGTGSYLVYRLIKNNNLYTAKLIQIITASSSLKADTDFGVGYGDWVVDRDNNHLYHMGYSESETSGIVKLTKFALPALTDGDDFASSTGDTIKVVTLESSGILDHYNLGNSYTLGLQDNCYYNGHIIISGWSYWGLVNLSTKEISLVPSNVGLGYGEAEGVDIYRGKMIVSYWNQPGLFSIEF